MAAVEFDACQKEADPSLAVNIHRNVADGSSASFRVRFSHVRCCSESYRIAAFR